MQIVNSEANSWYKDDDNDDRKANRHPLKRANDEDYTTTYQVKDQKADGNFLKLYLSQKYKIGTVTLTNRKEDCCEQRIIGTVVKVYSGEG